LQEALSRAGLTVEQIDAVELVGGCTRIPAIKERISAFFPGKTLGFTLNQDEAVARGATFACASLSPVFRVREFAVHDQTPYPIKVTWEKEPGNPDEDTELVVFPAGNPIPSTKILTFYRQGPFELEAKYDESATLPKGLNPWIGKYTIKNVEKPASGDLACVKVKARLNLHGIMNFESAYIVEEVEKEETVTVGEGEEAKEEKKLVKKLQRKGDCPTVGQYAAVTKDALDSMTEKEGKMHSEDKLVLETEVSTAGRNIPGQIELTADCFCRTERTLSRSTSTTCEASSRTDTPRTFRSLRSPLFSPVSPRPRTGCTLRRERMPPSLPTSRSWTLSKPSATQSS
jgi:heat shock protein 4